MERMKLRQAVIVEGKYDKIKLESLLDALILPTDGFQIFKDKAMLDYLRRLARERGLVILTDSDHAGFQIRGYLRGSIPEGQVTHVYIPDIYGKERRKDHPSKEGKLGVEGVSPAVLREAFARAGIVPAGREVPLEEARFTPGLFYELGLSGRPDSKRLRRAVLGELGLPENLSAALFQKSLETMTTPEDFCALVARVRAGLEPAS